MVFDATHLAAEQRRMVKPFRFSWDGREYELPSLKELPTRHLEEFESEQSVQDLIAFVEELAPEAADPIREMPMGVAGELFSAWGRTVGEAGKSPLPSSRKKRAGKPRKRT